MMHQTDNQRRAMEYQEGYQVLLNTRYIWFRSLPSKTIEEVCRTI